MGRKQDQYVADRATIALARIVIDAPPDKVYEKLSRARDWDKWLSVVRLIHTAQPDQLQSGNTISYTSRLAPGFIDGIVEDAEPGKVLAWGEKAMFGLIRGGSRWQLKRYSGGGRGMWLSSVLRPKTLVTLDQEVTGPLSCVVSNKSLDKHANDWLEELKCACELAPNGKKKKSPGK